MPQPLRPFEGYHVGGLHRRQPVFPHVMESEGPGLLLGETFHEGLEFGDKTFVILVTCFESRSIPAHSGDPFPQRIRCLLDVPPHTLGGFFRQNLR